MSESEAEVPPEPSVCLQENTTGQLLNELWQGGVPTVITLAKKEIASTSTPDDIYLMLPRMSYLAAASEECVNYFREYTAIIDKRNADGVWFEHESIPLKSHLPIGVLFDCYGAAVLPWRITLHFTGFPADILIKSGSPALMQKRYFHSLKQALFLLYGNARLFASLSLQSRVDIWNGICTSNFELFRDASQTIVPSMERSKVEYVPVRCVIVSETGKLEVTQKPIGVSIERIESVSVEGTDSDAQDILVQPTDLRKSPTMIVSTVRDILCASLGNRSQVQRDVRIQGVSISEDAPLFELWTMFAHSDLFLYISVFLQVE